MAERGWGPLGQLGRGGVGLKADRGVGGGRDWGGSEEVSFAPLWHPGQCWADEQPRPADGRQRQPCPGRHRSPRGPLTACCAESFSEGNSLQPGHMSCGNNTPGNGVGPRL